MFGLFQLDIYKDALHLASGLWAVAAAALSRRAAILFLRIFGLLYFLDGVVGVFTGSGYLDLSIITQGIRNLPASIGRGALRAGFNENAIFDERNLCGELDAGGGRHLGRLKARSGQWIAAVRAATAIERGIATWPSCRGARRTSRARARLRPPAPRRPR